MRYDCSATAWTSSGGGGAPASFSTTTQQIAQAWAAAVVSCRCDAEVATTRKKLSAVNRATHQRQTLRIGAAFSETRLRVEMSIRRLPLQLAE